MKNTIKLLIFIFLPCFLNAQKFDFKVSEIKDSTSTVYFFPLVNSAAYYNSNTNEYVNIDNLKEFSDTLNLYVRLDLCQNPSVHKDLWYPNSENTVLIIKLRDTMKTGDKYKLKCRVKLNDKTVKLSAINFVIDSTNILLSNLGLLSNAEFRDPQSIGLPCDTNDYYFKNKKDIPEFTNNLLNMNYIECCKWYNLESDYIIREGGEHWLYFNLVGNSTMLELKKKPLRHTISIDLDSIEIRKSNE